MGHPFFVGRKGGEGEKAGKENKGTTLYALSRPADAYDETIFRHTKGEVRSILNVCEELRLAV